MKKTTPNKTEQALIDARTKLKSLYKDIDYQSNKIKGLETALEGRDKELRNIKKEHAKQIADYSKEEFKLKGELTIANDKVIQWKVICIAIILIGIVITFLLR